MTDLEWRNKSFRSFLKLRGWTQQVNKALAGERWVPPAGGAHLGYELRDAVDLQLEEDERYEKVTKALKNV